MNTLQNMTVLLVLALTVSALGFLRVVYFVSLGYAFSVAGMAALSLVWFWPTLDGPTLAQCLLLAVYGLRLGTYLVRREREASYRRELAEVQARGSGLGRGKQVLIWLGVSLLYVLMFSPALANLELAALRPTPLTAWAGVALMGAGLAIEALADQQKAAYKREHPERFCDVKLYRWVRCPNYLGEILFWLGNFAAAVPSYSGALTWLAAAMGLLCIVLIMMGSTKRLEAKQDQRYGGQEDYQRYVRTVPVLFPFVPVYSLKKVRVYLE